MDRIDKLKEFINFQIESLNFSIDSLDQKSEMLIDLIINNRDKSIFLTGVGKAGLIARVVASSMNSVGLRSYYVYPNELMHGELGQIKTGDLIILVSKSGETEELRNLISHLKLLGTKLVLITTNNKSGISRFVDLTVSFQITSEHLLNGLAPSTSNIAFLTYFYAIMSVIISELKFTKSDFSRLHPSGSIGRKLNLAMRDLGHKAKYNNINDTSSFSDILLKLSASTIGSLTVLDVNKKVVGVITDGDIRRLLVNATLHELDLINAKEIMNKKPILVMNEELSYDVLKMMRQKGISFVPVVEKDSSFKYSIGIADLIEEGFDD